MTPVDPRLRHALEQLTGLTGDVAEVLGAYKRQLAAAGIAGDEAFRLMQALEARLLGPAFDKAEDIARDTPPTCGP